MYTQEISRQTPACFLFLLDQSGSMLEDLGGQVGFNKSGQLALAINGWLQNMIIKATGQSGIKDWMHVGVFGYRTDGDGNTIIEPCLPEPIADRPVVPISEINAHPLEIRPGMQQMFDQDTGEMQEFPVEVPVWVDPVADGGTPMCAMLDYAYQVLEYWVSEHKSSFPPIVVHITDGESTDGDPISKVQAIQKLATDDGQALVLNCHLSKVAADSIFFPASSEVMPDEQARTLFQMSSVLPEPMAARAIQEGFALQPGARAMVFNADMVQLLKFLDMGTRVAKNLR